MKSSPQKLKPVATHRRVNSTASPAASKKQNQTSKFKPEHPSHASNETASSQEEKLLTPADLISHSLVKMYKQEDDPLQELEYAQSATSVNLPSSKPKRSMTVAQSGTLHSSGRLLVSEKDIDDWEELDDRHLALFQALERTAHTEERSVRETLLKILREKGVELKDPRFKKELRMMREKEEELTASELKDVFRGKLRLLHKFVEGKLAVKKFTQLESELKELFQEMRERESGGKAADYIPFLKEHTGPECFGVSVCTTDGQRVSFGDSEKDVCLHALANIVTYCLTINERGVKEVHRWVKEEPSGQHFTSLSLTQNKRPHNAMINAGALMCCWLLGGGGKEGGEGSPSKGSKEQASPGKKDATFGEWEKYLSTVKQLCGKQPVGFSNEMRLSQGKHCFKNKALLHFMKAQGAFPPDTPLDPILDFYLNTQSLETTPSSLAVLAASLANGGICPLTEHRIFSEPDTVKCALSQMLMAGMYTFSGEWGFIVGLPAKSSVSGLTLLVVPNLLGMCILSTPLDANSNSAKGVQFARLFTERCGRPDLLDLYSASPQKVRGFSSSGASRGAQLLLYVAKRDLPKVRALVADPRTNLNFLDVEGITALDLAQKYGFFQIVGLLQACGGKTGAEVKKSGERKPSFQESPV